MARKNILFIMCDQLRSDYLGCTGHPTIRTPNIDKLAERGVLFSNAFCQSPICGPSRMSFYTGRYVSSHGSGSNFAPLRVGELNIGHHLNPLGLRTVLVGKTHIKADAEGLDRLGIDAESPVGVHHSQAGFEVYERDDGIHPDKKDNRDLNYNKYLQERGYTEDDNPWHWAANAVETEGGTVRSGYFNDQVDRPARVLEEESETPYMTRRAMEFLDADDGETPWLLHLSYIKPHWPYVAPAPYNDMYSRADVPPVNKHPNELDDPNPLVKFYHERVAGQTFGRDEARDTVIPVYMGLITQIDDQLGQLFDFMEARDLLKDTMIVFTSDHGDYMGDHWMGDKDFLHDPAVRIPLIIVDPDASADPARGTVDDSLVEAIDLLPTFVDYAGGTVADHILEGRSLMPNVLGQRPPERDYVISEYDYSCQVFRPQTGKMPRDCRTYMIQTRAWKYIHIYGFPPMLFDLEKDPGELNDLGRDPAYAEQRQAMHRLLADWSLQYRQRATWSEAKNLEMTGLEEDMGVLIGYWDEASAAGKDPEILPNRKAQRSSRATD